MITEVRVINTGEVLFRGEAPNDTAIHIYNDIKVEWVRIGDEEHWIIVNKPAKVTLHGDMLKIEKLPPEPELPDNLEPIKNYLHREWKISERKIYGDGWSIAEVYSGISADGMGEREMSRGNLSLLLNAPRTYEAMIALYNQYMDLYEEFNEDEIACLTEVAEVAKVIEQGA